jgi:hypothetical protein
MVMARQGYLTDPAAKHLEVFSNFEGGMNTMTADDTLSDAEFPDLVNKDLANRGTVKRRYGKVQHLAGQLGTGQGFFRYYKTGGGFDDIQASGGAIYVNGVSKKTGLQTTRVMEAVQFLDKLYIATGSGIYVWDGTNLTAIVPYKPNSLEALYIGTNGLAANPDNYVEDGTSTFVQINGMTVDKRYAVVNTPSVFTAFSSKPAGQVVEYQFEWKPKAATDDKWVIGRTWSTTKTYTWTPTTTGDFEFRVSVRKQGQTLVEGFYSLPKYIVKPQEDPEDKQIATSTINTCNRILLHWNRLIIYGDTTNKDVIYISHLNKPEYFPTLNSLQFTNDRQEGLTALVQFRDNIVAFTNTSIQALYGKSPQDYRRVVLNTAIGCMAPKSARVMGNYITFLSYEGVHVLKSLGMSEDRMNVEPIDTNVKDEIQITSNAVGEVFENQYHIVFPDQQKRMRFYYERGVWVKDTSTKFNYGRMAVLDGDLYAYDNLGAKVYRYDETVYTDDGYVYEDRVETKYHDFKEQYKMKKIRELQFITTALDTSTAITVDIIIDNEEVANDIAVEVPAGAGLLEPINGYPSVRHKVKAAGKGYSVKLIIKHTQAKPFHLIGYGFIFKLKKP